MKSLKAILAATALAVAFTAPLQAQEKKGGQSPDQQIEHIEHAVGKLTADQKSKIAAIIGKTMEAMRGMPKEERKEKGGALRKKQQEDIRAVLTPEQQKKYDEMAASMKKKKN